MQIGRFAFFDSSSYLGICSKNLSGLQQLCIELKRAHGEREERPGARKCERALAIFQSALEYAANWNLQHVFVCKAAIYSHK